MSKYILFMFFIFFADLSFPLCVIAMDDASNDLSTGLAQNAESARYSVHGFLSQGYIQSDHNNFLAETDGGTFQFNEFGLNFSTRLTDSLEAGIQFFGRDMGTVGNDEVRIDWAFLNYNWKDWAGFKIGRMKMVYGLYNEVREMDMLRTRTFLPQSVYVEVYRDSMAVITGGDVYGHIPSGVFGSFIYEFQVGVLPFSVDDGVSRLIESTNYAWNLEMTDVDSDYSFSYGITWESPVDGLRLRYSGFEVKCLYGKGAVSAILPVDINQDGTIASGEGIPVSTFDLDYKLVRFDVASAEFTKGDLVLAAEYMNMDLVAHYQLGPAKVKRNTPYLGWYVSGDYRFNDLFTLGLSYSEFYPNANDKDGKTQVAAGRNDYQGWQKTFTVSTKFDVTSSWLLKLEASHNDGFGTIQPFYNSPENIEPYWWLFSAKATVSF